jgi:hypothetical protein
VAGDNRLTLTLEREAGVAPGYLSRLYLGNEAEVVPNYRLRAFITDQLKAMSHAAHLLIILGVTAGYIWRRGDAVFQWLALLAALSIAVALTEIPLLSGIVGTWRPIFLLAASSAGLVTVGLSLAHLGLPRPFWLKAAIIALPVVCLGWPSSCRSRPACLFWC